MSAVAGFCWAATLVNLRHPHVLERLLIVAAERPAWRIACRSGVASALEAWRRCARDDEDVIAFTRHVPRGDRARIAWTAILRALPDRSALRASDLFASAAGGGEPA